MTNTTLLRLGNTLVYLFFLSSNLYDVTGGDAQNDYGLHPSLLTPAPYAFAIWGLIHLLFLGFVMWQWTASAEKVVRDAFGSYFVIAAFLTAMWHHYWIQDHKIIALILLLFASASITIIYHNLSKFPAQTWVQRLFVHAPVSLYHGWLVFVAWLNATTIFFNLKNPEHPPILQQIVVGLILAQLASTAIAYAHVRRDHNGDVAGSMALLWALVAVAVNQEAMFIRYFSAAMALVVFVSGFMPILTTKYKTIRHGENQPLLGQ